MSRPPERPGEVSGSVRHDLEPTVRVERPGPVRAVRVRTFTQARGLSDSDTSRTVVTVSAFLSGSGALAPTRRTDLRTNNENNQGEQP